MNNVLLDTCVLVEILHKNQNVKQIITDIGWENCYISDITVVELLFGAEVSQNPQKNLPIVKSLLKSFAIIPFSVCINYFCKEKARLSKIGKLIDDNDLYIGTTAVAVNMPIYTYNVKHFSRIEGLKLYDIN
ncbi:MAG: PIN domain-containing protein [Bacteroidales bacterium]|nr:PIN domain-containing protein [Bacteroidales bacterium]